MTFSIGIPTISRKWNYRRQLFRRLIDTGTLEHPLLRGFHVTYEAPPNENAYRAMLAAASDDVDWVLFLEDDIDIVDDFIGSVDRWLFDVQLDDIKIYPLGCAVRRAMAVAKNAQQIAWAFPVNKFFGATGLAMRPDDVRGFCAVAQTKPAWMMDWNGLDVNLSRWHDRVVPEQPFLLTPTTCLVDHCGAVSSQSDDPTHFTGRYAHFAGRSYSYRKDAL